MKNAVIITARSKSSRLPKKILKKFEKNLRSIDILIRRAQYINLPIVLATTTKKSDDRLCKHVQTNYKIKIFRGDDKNKLLRWYKCFQKFRIKNACIIDGDDIFFDYNVYKKLIKHVKNYDILSAHKSMVTGIFTHIISMSALKKMYKYFINDIDSEMIEPFTIKAKLKTKHIKLEKIYHNKKIRLTLDYIEDFKVFSILIKIFNTSSKTIDIMNYMLKNKKVANINYHRESFWRKNQKKKINSIDI